MTGRNSAVVPGAGIAFTSWIVVRVHWPLKVLRQRQWRAING
jgi:hypothetical protein